VETGRHLICHIAVAGNDGSGGVAGGWWWWQWRSGRWRRRWGRQQWRLVDAKLVHPHVAGAVDKRRQLGDHPVPLGQKKNMDLREVNTGNREN